MAQKITLEAITDKRPCDEGWGFYVMRGARFYRDGKQITREQVIEIVGDPLSYSAKDVMEVSFLEEVKQ
jgi:hypothetical protein